MQNVQQKFEFFQSLWFFFVCYDGGKVAFYLFRKLKKNVLAFHFDLHFFPESVCGRSRT
jgi:hypothetical protein